MFIAQASMPERKKKRQQEKARSKRNNEWSEVLARLLKW